MWPHLQLDCEMFSECAKKYLNIKNRENIRFYILFCLLDILQCFINFKRGSYSLYDTLCIGYNTFSLSRKLEATSTDHEQGNTYKT